MGYASNQFPKREKSEKPKVGKLWYNGKIIISNRPFKFLQFKKKELLATGYYKKELFKISY